MVSGLNPGSHIRQVVHFRSPSEYYYPSSCGMSRRFGCFQNILRTAGQFLACSAKASFSVFQTQRIGASRRSPGPRC